MLGFINNYYTEPSRQARLTFRYFSFSRDSRVQEPFSFSFSLSLFFSFFFSLFLLFSAGQIDIRARMRLRASSTSSFTWLPQERGLAESISHTDIFDLVLVAVATSFSYSSKVVLIIEIWRCITNLWISN